MKKFLESEVRRIHEEMCQSHQRDIAHHRAFGDALALCLVAIVGISILMMA